MTSLNLISLLGLFVLGGLAWVVGGLRRPVAWRTVMGSGLVMLALGTCTHQNNWRLVEPDITPDSSTSGGTFCKPSIMFRTIGGQA